MAPARRCVQALAPRRHRLGAPAAARPRPRPRGLPSSSNCNQENERFQPVSFTTIKDRGQRVTCCYLCWFGHGRGGGACCWTGRRRREERRRGRTPGFSSLMLASLRLQELLVVEFSSVSEEIGYLYQSCTRLSEEAPCSQTKDGGRRGGARRQPCAVARLAH
jgi:hypothetical protein